MDQVLSKDTLPALRDRLWWSLLWLFLGSCALGLLCLLYAAGLNIDYFPTNFIPRSGTLYYVDYECNAYMEEWSFENWGVKYWSKTPEFMAYAAGHPIA